MNKKTIHWGILGPGAIAYNFAEGLKYVKNAKLTAVGSRDIERAKNFALKYNIPFAFGSYEELARCEEVDVIYVATPHGRHYEDMLLCLDNDKNILCEKSFTLNARQATHVLDRAKQKNVFIMEAMWTLFMPVIFKLKELLKDGVIGRLTFINADLGFHFPFDPEHRVYNPQLGGGALLDIGVYPLSLCYHLFGVPDEIKALALIGKTGVDEQDGILFKYGDGPLAHLYASLRSQTPSEALFIGTKGTIRLHAPLYRPAGITVKVDGQKELYFDAGLAGNGYNYEAEEVGRCLIAGKTESGLISHRHTLEVMELMDTIRSQWGMRYPGENYSGN